MEAYISNIACLLRYCVHICTKKWIEEHSIKYDSLK